MYRRFQIIRTLGIAMAFILAAPPAFPWGNNANKLIVNRAIDTLPEDIRPFFESSRSILYEHVNDPFVTVAKTPAERKNQFLYLEKYGRFPFDTLPRNYKAARRKIR